jgi:hypothetical protein
MCVHPLLGLLKPRSAATLSMRHLYPSLCHSCQSWSNSRCLFVHLWAFSEAILCQTCDSLSWADGLTENSAWNLWKFTWRFRNCEAVFLWTRWPLSCRWPPTSNLLSYSSFTAILHHSCVLLEENREQHEFSSWRYYQLIARHIITHAWERAIRLFTKQGVVWHSSACSYITCLR